MDLRGLGEGTLSMGCKGRSSYKKNVVSNASKLAKKSLKMGYMTHKYIFLLFVLEAFQHFRIYISTGTPSVVTLTIFCVTTMCDILN